MQTFLNIDTGGVDAALRRVEIVCPNLTDYEARFVLSTALSVGAQGVAVLK